MFDVQGGGEIPGGDAVVIGAAMAVLIQAGVSRPTNSQVFEVLARALARQAIEMGASSPSEAAQAAGQIMIGHMEKIG